MEELRKLQNQDPELFEAFEAFDFFDFNNFKQIFFELFKVHHEILKFCLTEEGWWLMKWDAEFYDPHEQLDARHKGFVGYDKNTQLVRWELSHTYDLYPSMGRWDHGKDIVPFQELKEYLYEKLA